MKSGYDNFFSQVKKTRDTVRISSRQASTPSGNDTRNQAAQRARLMAARKKRVRAPIPLQLIVTIVLGLSLTTLAWIKQDSILDWLEKIEIGVFTGASAEEKAHSPEGKSKEKVSAKTDETSGASHSESVELSSKSKDADDHAHIKKFMQRKKELDEREAELAKMEDDLKAQREALDTRIKELEKIRAQIGDVLKDKVEVDSGRVDKLVDFYSNMKPAQAAKIMETMNEDLVVETLSRMKKKSAADIMNLLEAKKAQSISEKFAGYRRK